MVRKIVALAVLLVALLPLAASGAAADVPLPGLPGASGDQAEPAAAPADGGDVIHPEWGRTEGESGVLRKGCKRYRYHYDITPPEGDWVLEVFISGPGLEHLAAGAYMGGYDPEQNVGVYTLCKVTTGYGRFTIKAKLSVQNGPEDYVEGWLPPSHFRLRAPHRHHSGHH